MVRSFFFLSRLRPLPALLQHASSWRFVWLSGNIGRNGPLVHGNPALGAIHLHLLRCRLRVSDEPLRIVQTYFPSCFHMADANETHPLPYSSTEQGHRTSNRTSLVALLAHGPTFTHLRIAIGSKCCQKPFYWRIMVSATPYGAAFPGMRCTCRSRNRTPSFGLAKGRYVIKICLVPSLVFFVSSVAALAVSRRELMDDGPYYVLGNGDAGMPVQLDGKSQTVEETSVDCLFETFLLMSGRLAAVPSSPPKVHPLQMDRATNSENTLCSPSHTPSYTNVAGRSHPGI